MKKKALLFCILIDVLAVGLIPLNVLLLNFDIPEFADAVNALIVMASAVLFFLKSPAGKPTKAALLIAAVFSAVISIGGSYCNPYWNGIMFRVNTDYGSKAYDHRLGPDEAVKDLEYAMKYLRKLHPAAYGGIPKNIERQYEIVKARLEKCSGISVNELAKEIESIFSILRDGHTYICGNYEDRRILKYYRKWTEEGNTISAVNGISVEELLDKMSAYYSFEAASWQYELLLDDMVTSAGIDYLGFDIGDGVEYTITSEDGQIRTEICCSEDFLGWDEYAEFNGIAEEETEGGSFVGYEIDTENHTAVLRLDQCTYNREYTGCVRKLFEEVKSKKIENVAVDLRYNGGGSSQVITEFFKYLDIDSYKTVTIGWRLGFIFLNLGDGVCENEKYEDLLFDGNLYLLTSASTFSSAMMFAEYVKDNGLGTIIGEAPGNNPNGYGEIVVFKLPVSKLYMQVSTKRFYRADRECTDELVCPDIECSSEIAMEELLRLE